MTGKSEQIRLLMITCAFSMALTGCVTTQGPTGTAGTSVAPIATFDLGDLFAPKVGEFKKLVNESKYREAEEHLEREHKYFSDRYSKPESIIPEEFRKLAQHNWKNKYEANVKKLTSDLGKFDLQNTALWLSYANQVSEASKLLGLIKNDRALDFAKNWASYYPDEVNALGQEISRVTLLANNNFSNALRAMIPDVIANAQHTEIYPVKPIRKTDFQGDSLAQTQFLVTILGNQQKEELEKNAKRLNDYLSQDSKGKVDQAYADLYKKELLADNVIDLQELVATLSLKTPFGGSADALSSIVNIGYIDLTAASFKNRNIFDFEITFKQDLPVTAVSAKDAVFTSADIKGYDYIFVTDLTTAKIMREFKSKKEIKSRVQTGTRSDQNPDYVTALSEYQQAMSNMQRAQISSAMPKSCYGWGCLVQGIADGIGTGVAKKRVEEATAKLSATSQTVSSPVYSDYAYQSVDINASKLAQVDYYLIDVKKKRIHKNFFELKDHEKFTVSYNVQDNDPDKASILRNNQTEADVTAWEKKPVSISLKALFDPDNQKSATTQALTTFELFLKNLGSRSYASASPTYATSGTTSTSPRDAKQIAGELKQSSASYRSQTIADERFDSIVIIKNGRSIGTGFYVTPELVLTAYHVVKEGNLVEMTYYDGTKTYGKVIDHDVRLDLALVKAQTAGRPLKIHTGAIKLGETVEAIGHPKNYEFTITRGVISAVRKLKGTVIGTESLVEFIQTDTPISPGNSGGPLLLRDTVIGVNDWIRVDKGSQNLNFSVSYNEIREYLNRSSGRQ